jgi:uncharacterized protein (TIRG00374 family)
MKLALKWLASLALAALFIWLSSRQWPMAQLVCRELELTGGTLICHAAGGIYGPPLWSVRLWWLLPAVGVLVAVHFLRVWRWAPLMAPLGKFDFWTLNCVGAVSFLALFVFPLRLGEFARPYLIARTGKVRKSAAFGTIAVERVMDGLMMALLLALVLFALPVENEAAYLSLRAGATLALLVFSGAMGLLVVAWLSKRHAVRLVELVVGPFSRRFAERASGMMGAFIDGMKAMPSWENFLGFILATMFYWAVNGFYFYLVAHAFGLTDVLDVPAAFAMMAAVAVGMMIPNSPANVGSFWYFLLLPVALYPPTAEPGGPLAFALAVWGLMLLQYALFAGYFLVTGKVSLDSLWSLQRGENGSEGQ